MRYCYKAALSLAFAAVAYSGVKHFCYKQTDGFTILGITPNRAFEKTFEARPLTNEEQVELKYALDQPYSYGAYGAQAFIFFSQDGKYALKLFKQRIYTTPLWFSYLRIPFIFDRYKEKKAAHRLDKCRRDFASYKLAFEELQDLTGVIFVHLNPTSSLQKKLHIIDKLGIAHQIDLDKMDFILQKKAEHVHKRIQRQMQNQDIEGAKHSISSLVTMIVERCKRGVSDRDSSIDTNCGFLDGAAIKIDVGRLGFDKSTATSANCKAELISIAAPFKEWLSSRYSELAKHLDQECVKAEEPFTSQPSSTL